MGRSTLPSRACQQPCTCAGLLCLRLAVHQCQHCPAQGPPGHSHRQDALQACLPALHVCSATLLQKTSAATFIRPHRRVSLMKSAQPEHCCRPLLTLPCPHPHASNQLSSQGVPINTAPVNSHTARGYAVLGHKHYAPKQPQWSTFLQYSPDDTVMGAQSGGRQQALVHFTLSFASTPHGS